MDIQSHRNKDYNASIPFRVVAPYEPMGDQPQAIKSLADGVKSGQWAQVLLGATGTGKTFTMAKVIEAVQKPTLVIAHNKTLAAQLASEFKAFFQTMKWLISSVTTTFINQKRTLPRRIRTSKRTRLLTTKSTSSATRRRWLSLSGVT